MNYAKSTLGGTVSIQANMDSIRDNQKLEIKNGGDPSEMFKNMARPSVDVKTANLNNNGVQLNINTEHLDYLLLFVTGYLVIFLALILSSASVMRYQPKEILTGKE